MKDTLHKIALVTLILSGAIFIVLMFTVSLWATTVEGIFVSPLSTPIVLVFLVIAGVIYVGLAVYLLFVNFSQNEKMRKIMLYRDGNSEASTSFNVAKKMIVRTAKQLTGTKIKKVKIKHIDNLVSLTVSIAVKSPQIEHTIDTLRCLVADTFYSVLGVKFDTINFEVKRITNYFKSSVEDAESKANELKAQRVAKQRLEDDIPQEEEVDEIAQEVAETTQQAREHEIDVGQQAQEQDMATGEERERKENTTEQEEEEKGEQSSKEPVEEDEKPK